MKEVPNVDAMMKAQPLHSTKVYISPTHETLTIYQAKRTNWYVCQCTKRFLLIKHIERNYVKQSSITTGQKWVSMFLIKWLGITHALVLQEDGLWLFFFFNIIDCACVNAYIIYSEVTNQSMSRREFLLLLIKEMCGEFLAESTPALPSFRVHCN